MKNKKNNKIVAFLLLLLTITVGYALLSQQLDINGTSKIKKTTWSIIWDNVEVNTNSVKGESVTQAAQITNTEKTLVEYSITLSEPGEFYEFTVDAKNEGTIDGMINTVSNKVYESNGTTERQLPAYLTYSVTYSDGKAIEPKQLLKAGTTEKYKVRVEFKDVEASLLPTQNETLKFKFEVEYVQADGSAQVVTHTLTGIRYTIGIASLNNKLPDNAVLYLNESEAKKALGSYMYLKHEIENDIVRKSYVCFEKNNNTYCLQGGINEEDEDNHKLDNSPVYDANKVVLQSAFESNQCGEYYFGNEEGQSTYFSCTDSSDSAQASATGDIGFDSSSNSITCYVYGVGDSGCLVK